MSLTSHPLDQQARQQFNDFAAEPPAAAWQQIATRLDSEPQRRPLAGWWLGSVVVLAVLALLGFAAWGTSAADTPHAASLASPTGVLAKADIQARTPSGAGSLAGIEAATGLSKVTQPNAAVTGTSRSTAAIALAIVSPGQPATSAPAAEQELAALSAKTASSAAPKATLTAARVPPPHLQTALTAANKDNEAAAPSLQFSRNQSMFLLPQRNLHIDRFAAPDLILPAIPCENFRRRGTWYMGLRASFGLGLIQRTWENTEPELRDYELLRDSFETIRLSPAAEVRAEFYHSSGLMLRLGADYRLDPSRVVLCRPHHHYPLDCRVRDPISNSIIRTDTVLTSTRTQGTLTIGSTTRRSSVVSATASSTRVVGRPTS